MKAHHQKLAHSKCLQIHASDISHGAHEWHFTFHKDLKVLGKDECYKETDHILEWLLQRHVLFAGIANQTGAAHHSCPSHNNCVSSESLNIQERLVNIKQEETLASQPASYLLRILDPS